MKQKENNEKMSKRPKQRLYKKKKKKGYLKVRNMKTLSIF